MPNSRPNAETLTNTGIAASEARNMENTEVTNKTDIAVVEQRSARAETTWTSSEIFIADARNDKYPEMTLADAAPFMGRNRDNVASILEWRGTVLQSRRATQTFTSSFCKQQTAEERWRASLEVEIWQIREDFHEKKKRLEKEIVKLEQKYRLDMKQLEKEESEDNYSVTQAEWEVQSDYEPTECGSGYRMES